MNNNRYLIDNIKEDLIRKMVFIGGPRQVGKTTFARTIAKTLSEKVTYLNWDRASHRSSILKEEFDTDLDILILDEIHKYRPWKRLVKGIYDTREKDEKIIVTGSARLDTYRKGGDSLLGRYHYYRLHPFSIAEMCSKKSNIDAGKELAFPSSSKESNEYLKSLMLYGGFPEPLFSENARALRRWQKDRVDRLVREDIRDLENIRDISLLLHLVEILPDKVGSLLSINAIREDLNISHRAVSSWVDILEKMYYHFRVYPYTNKAIRSLKKEPKLYLWDWSEVQDIGARFENLIASHLLKFVHYLQDSEGDKAELYFLRDQDKREVDFLITLNQKPWFCVEAKSSDKEESSHIRYFAEKLKIPFCFQVVQADGIDKTAKNIRIISASKFLAGFV